MWTTRKFTEVVAVHCYFNRRRLLTPKAMAFKPPLLQCNSSMKKITKAINFLVWKITRNKYNNPKVLPQRLWEFNNLEDKFFCTIWLSCTQVAHNIIFFLEEKLYVCVFFFYSVHTCILWCFSFLGVISTETGTTLQDNV